MANGKWGEQVNEHRMVEHRLRLIRPHVDGVVVMVKGSIREDTRDTSLLESRERLEKHYSL
jgi:energy-coupling factor transporter ATP-binding protein EcfA2